MSRDPNYLKELEALDDAFEQGVPPKPPSQSWMAVLMRQVFEKEIMALREAGQKEYAHAVDNCFANFERVAADLGIDRKMVLWTYARKHIDGIASFLKGHKSQREDVRGRINDTIVYLNLLRGMIDQEDAAQTPSV